MKITKTETGLIVTINRSVAKEKREPWCGTLEFIDNKNAVYEEGEYHAGLDGSYNYHLNYVVPSIVIIGCGRYYVDRVGNIHFFIYNSANGEVKECNQDQAYEAHQLSEREQANENHLH